MSNIWCDVYISIIFQIRPVLIIASSNFFIRIISFGNDCAFTGVMTITWRLISSVLFEMLSTFSWKLTRHICSRWRRLLTENSYQKRMEQTWHSTSKYFLFWIPSLLVFCFSVSSSKFSTSAFSFSSCLCDFFHFYGNVLIRIINSA